MQRFDAGLDGFSRAQVALGDVRVLGCFACDGGGRVVAGEVARTWCECVELQQRWVETVLRRRGIAGRLLVLFEQRAAERGCTPLYLETFNFQAPQFYRRCGYPCELEWAGCPQGILKFSFLERL